MRYSWTLAASAALAQAGSLKDIKHIVLFMQENRAFDHYFGTMAGVRGFADPNVPVNNGRSTFEQTINGTQNGVDTLKPWHLNYMGGDWANRTQCAGAGDNGWGAMHTAYNSGKGDGWIAGDGPYSLGYFNRDDIPTHFDIAEGWTVMDMSRQPILGPTDPNRIMWMSGSLNIPGSPTNLDGEGGMILDNTATPGCEQPKINCFPFVWKTFPEYLEDAGVSWQVWQDFDNFEDNMLAYFDQYQQAKNGSALRTKGNSYPGLDAFYKAAADGTLPQVSWIVGPQEFAEHPPNMPIDGAWLQKKVVDAITNSPAYHETALIISYDEQGGWYDHLPSQVAPKGTAGEWLKDPYGNAGDVPLGPGPRTPRYIISPWTRGGNVFTENADHTSDMMFVEEWASANGYKVKTEAITEWRRQHMSNLVNAFDFSKSDTSSPNIFQVRDPEGRPGTHWSGNLTLGSLTGPWVGPAHCLSDFPTNKPPVPYGKDNVNQDLSKLVEEGFKQVRGKINEGRYLTIEFGPVALTNFHGAIASISPATKRHDNINQRWILHSVKDDIYDNTFYLQSAADSKYISNIGQLTTNIKRAQAFTFDYHANGATYSLRQAHTNNKFVGPKNGASASANSGSASASASAVSWAGPQFNNIRIFSVSYHNSVSTLQQFAHFANTNNAAVSVTHWTQKYVWTCTTVAMMYLMS